MALNLHMTDSSLRRLTRDTSLHTTQLLQLAARLCKVLVVALLAAAAALSDAASCCHHVSNAPGWLNKVVWVLFLHEKPELVLAELAPNW
jgi:hypothetical protein